MMYRDDREALRDEVVQLKRELEQARGDQERLVDVEKRLEAANRELASLQARLGGAPQPRRSAAVPIAVAAVVFVGALGAGLMLTVRSRSVSAPVAPAL